jgi:hypothetical protein
VHNKGTFAQALQAECMEVWNVTIGSNFQQLIKHDLIQDITDLNSGHDAFRHPGLQRFNHAKKFKSFILYLNVKHIYFKILTLTVLHQMHWRKSGLRKFFLLLCA